MTENGFTPSENEKWTTLDDDWINAVAEVTSDREKIAKVRGLGGYGEWKIRNLSAKYIHTDGTSYNFTKSLEGGSGNEESRCFYFKPKGACTVTVVFASDQGRTMKICQGGSVLASAEGRYDEITVISADVENPSDGDVYVYGGSCNKDLFAIFADYYNPLEIVLKNVSGTVSYVGEKNISGKQLIFTDTKDKTEYKAGANSAYSVNLRQNRKYDVRVCNADGSVCGDTAVTLDTNSLTVERSDKEFNVKLVDVAETEIKGNVTVHEFNNDGKTLDLSKVYLTFTAADNKSLSYTTGISDNKISPVLMPGHKYRITASGIEGYELSPLSKEYDMLAGDMSPFKNILFTECVNEVTFSHTIRVGEDKQYTRINDAVTAVKKMNRRRDESGSVTILVDAGVYTEQVMLDEPYITLKAADMNRRPVIQWYYGVGYLYYSADNGYYNEDYAAAKVRKGPVKLWGAACRVTGEHVNIEGVIFKNTLCCEITDEEIADGAEAAKNNEYCDVNGKTERTAKNFDPMSIDTVERAAAIALEANHIEVYNCDFISSQDTFYTNGVAYVKDCYIEGGTDYIYGGNSVVFENCTLAWHGYSGRAKGGHITANRNEKKAEINRADIFSNGYLLRNCTITNSKYYPQNNFAGGSWGRNWGGENCHVVFDGIRLDGVDAPDGWKAMTYGIDEALFFVGNVTDKDGNRVNVKRNNPNGTMSDNGYRLMEPSEYFGGWIPPHFDSNN